MSQHPTPSNPTQAVFERVIARPVAAPSPQHGRLVHIAWSAPHQGARVVQAYANGRWTAVSASPTDRELWLVLDAGKHHEIELLAVDPIDAATPSQSLLGGIEPPTTPAVSVGVLRDPSLPIRARLHATLNAAAGVSTRVCPPDAARGGFGSVFGEGGFGYDATPGPGLGAGELGLGPLGVGGEALRWCRDGLPAGEHTLRLEVRDEDGHAITPALDTHFTLTRLPDPPSGVALDADLQLTWT
ncbi:MAG: hypothetical protein ACE37H_10690 [Phycisphaeraceae bacterium]